MARCVDLKHLFSREADFFGDFHCGHLTFCRLNQCLAADRKIYIVLRIFFAPVALTLLLTLILGFLFGQSLELGWGLPLGTSLTLFIASLGLFVTLHNSFSARRHNRLSVKPHLILDSLFDSSYRDDHHTYTLKVKNVGLGPAIINAYTISLDSVANIDPHSVFEELLRMVNKHTPAKGRSHCVAGYLEEGNAIDKGTEKILVQISIPTDGRSFMEGRKIAKELVKLIDTSIKYQCHYGSTNIVTKKYNHEPKQLGQQDTALGAAA